VNTFMLASDTCRSRKAIPGQSCAGIDAVALKSSAQNGAAGFGLRGRFSPERPPLNAHMES
jgi:hypothetical protein